MGSSSSSIASAAVAWVAVVICVVVLVLVVVTETYSPVRVFWTEVRKAAYWRFKTNTMRNIPVCSVRDSGDDTTSVIKRYDIGSLFSVLYMSLMRTD